MEKIGLEQSGKGLFHFHGFSLISLQFLRQEKGDRLGIFLFTCSRGKPFQVVVI